MSVSTGTAGLAKQLSRSPGREAGTRFPACAGESACVCACLVGARPSVQARRRKFLHVRVCAPARAGAGAVRDQPFIGRRGDEMVAHYMGIIDFLQVAWNDSE